MASALEQVLLASALESLNIDHYWSEFSTSKEIDEENDSEYPIILLFYETLLDDMLNRSFVRKDAVQNAISHLTANYRHTFNGSTPDNLDYNDLNNCFGYLHRYAACHTALVRTVLKTVFHVSPPAAIKRILSLKDSLEVVSLGGGPGNDIVGFCSALYGKHYGLLKIDITIVDEMAGWERIFFQTERMLRHQTYGNASALFKDVNIQTFYLQADLTNRNSWNSSLRAKLESADILLLVKVLSVIPDREKVDLLQGVVSLMKPGALLIYIDCPFPSEQFSSVEQWVDCVYESDKNKFQFNYEVERFGYPNITASHAYVRVYVKRFINVQL